MIRGAIDYIDGQSVSGWFHSDVVELRGRTAMAFVDGQCVGAGQVDLFRQDLADAGVGDGFGGFHFGITLPSGSLDRLVVKFENSDLVLLQPGSKLAGAPTPLRRACQDGGAGYSPHSVEWMRGRGWLDQVEFDFLKSVATIGLYDRSLRRNNIESFDAQGQAAGLFELYVQDQANVAAETIRLDDLAARRGTLIAGMPIPIVAVHAPTGRISILEGSHELPFQAAPEMTGAVQHKCAVDRLLFVDLRLALTAEGPDAQVFTVR